MSSDLHTSVTDSCLDTARDLGERICGEANWDSSRKLCNWVYRSPSISSQAIEPETLGSLDAGLYSGVGGIALFLLHLARQTGSRTFRDTAIGAIRTANAQLRGDINAHSLFTGAVGTAYLNCEASKWLEFREGASIANSVVSQLSRTDTPSNQLDVISGLAGAVPALLAISGVGGSELARDVAVRYGTSITESCRQIEPIIESIKSEGPRVFANRMPLLGYAHGAAGLVGALVQLYHASGRSGYREVAFLLGLYISRVWELAKPNCPDLRGFAPLEYLPRARGWCHGAAGIMLAFGWLTLCKSVPDVPVSNMVQAMRELTLAEISDTFSGECPDASLCHGFAGSAEALLACSEMKLVDDFAIALNVGKELVDSWIRSNQWCSGLESGFRTGSLMLGDAGVGLFLLRLARPRINPSLLALALDHD